MIQQRLLLQLQCRLVSLQSCCIFLFRSKGIDESNIEILENNTVEKKLKSNKVPVCRKSEINKRKAAEDFVENNIEEKDAMLLSNTETMFLNNQVRFKISCIKINLANIVNRTVCNYTKPIQ